MTVTIVIDLDEKYAERFEKDAQALVDQFLRSMVQDTHVKFKKVEVMRWYHEKQDKPFKLVFTEDNYKSLFEMYAEELE